MSIQGQVNELNAIKSELKSLRSRGTFLRNRSKKIEDEIGRAIAQDRAEAIVLGCAGMADLAQAMSERFGVPVLDGLACAVGLCESMVRLHLRTSRIGGYAPPPAHKRG